MTTTLPGFLTSTAQRDREEATIMRETRHGGKPGPCSHWQCIAATDAALAEIQRGDAILVLGFARSLHVDQGEDWTSAALHAALLAVDVCDAHVGVYKTTTLEQRARVLDAARALTVFCIEVKR
jgi:hypothetical protein